MRIAKNVPDHHCRTDRKELSRRDMPPTAPWSQKLRKEENNAVELSGPDGTFVLATERIHCGQIGRSGDSREYTGWLV